jgi:hypothetical protein
MVYLPQHITIMNTLLLEYLDKILNEVGTTAGVSKKAQLPGSVLLTPQGNYRAKRVSDGKVLYWGDERVARAWITGEIGDDEGASEDGAVRDSGSSEKATRSTSQTTPQRAQTPPTKSTVQRQITTVNIAMDDLRRRGIAGAGGAAASQGESLFKQFSNSLQKVGGFLNLMRKVVKIESTKFSKLATDYSLNEKTDRLSTVALKTLRNTRNQLAADFGWDEYDDNNQANRETVAQYLAVRQIYVDERLKEAKTACGKKQEHVFCKKGAAGFGKNDDAYSSWLEAAFDGAVRLDALIRSGDTRLDPQKPWVVMQSDTSEDAVVGGRSPDTIVLNQLKKLAESVQGEDRDHYEYQIKLFDTLGYHDTFVVGEDSKGRMVVLHNSNKKTNDMSDPHNNTTPETRLLILKEKYSTDPELQAAAEEMSKILDDQLAIVRNIKTATVNASGKLQITPSMVQLAESSYMTKYMGSLDTLASNTRKGSFGEWLSTNSPKKIVERNGHGGKIKDGTEVYVDESRKNV